VRPHRRSGAGFTLLEVLAATLIFAIVMVVLIGSSTEAIHRVGLSASRLEASALADRELARLESVLQARAQPPQDYEETVDDFVIRVWSEPALNGNDAPSQPPPGPGLDLAGGGAGLAALGPMIQMVAPGIEAFLLRYEIRVEWIEGVAPGSVGRTTYAFDWPGAQAALPDLFPIGDAAGLGLERPESLGSEADALLEQLQSAGKP
jgi:prepilin-type N-terminal cleavage/methylation domain-containing protein